ncbi:MAG TPA: hypothetical protein VN958_01445 [Chitinophagaceae bacterium]|nr:hypothetical protein [Chitinophagaceae bacterium]
MRKISILSLLLSLLITTCITGLFTSSCTKESSIRNHDNYNSVADFYDKNGVAMQHFSVNASTGGTFTTPQGTVISIPANILVDHSGNTVGGAVDIEFRDIYKKSDMLLSNMPTNFYGRPLKSAGEFFIRAKSNNKLLQIAPLKKIEINQPANNELIDSMMLSFLGVKDTANGINWNCDSIGVNFSVYPSLSGYVFSLYNFANPLDSGTWCNSDNPSYFSAYPITTLTLRGNDDVDTFNTDVFLVFKNINCMVHVYRSTENDFPYLYAPEGLECTIVALGVKDEKIYSAFIPITISGDKTVNFTLSETTTDEFKAQLNLLND